MNSTRASIGEISISEWTNSLKRKWQSTDSALAKAPIRYKMNKRSEDLRLKIVTSASESIEKLHTTVVNSSN